MLPNVTLLDLLEVPTCFLFSCINVIFRPALLFFFGQTLIGYDIDKREVLWIGHELDEASSIQTSLSDGNVKALYFFLFLSLPISMHEYNVAQKFVEAFY